MNENLAVKDNKKILSIGIIITAIVILSSIVIYSSVIKPQKYSNYLDLGNKYLLEQNYEEAILAFEKAIKIEEKSTEARIGAAKAYIGINDVDNAVIYLEQAQNLDKTNESLLKEIIDILIPIDSQVAYEFLEKFIDEVGEGNISEYIKNLLDESKELPSDIKVSPEPGTYINPITVELDLNSVKFGHEYYYTMDGSIPNKSSQKYTKDIKIEQNTQINIIGYNAKGESTDVYEIKYIIDDKAKTQLNELIKETNSLLDNTEEGTKVGNCKPGSKENLKNTVQQIEKQLQDKILSYDYVNQMKKQLNSAIDIFNNNIIKNNDIEKKIMGKSWINSYGDIILVKENKIKWNGRFHEGIDYDIIDKNIEENRINYKVNSYGDISNVSITIDGNNTINITSNNVMNGKYVSADKNQLLNIAHEEYLGNYSSPDVDKECKGTIVDYYLNYRFEEYGISRNDVKNYCKNNCIR